MTTDQDRESLARGDDAERAPEAPADAPEAAAAPSGDATPDAPEDFRDRWLRAEADLQNFRRRAAREREETRRAAQEGVLLELIAALDDLDRALAAMGERAAEDPLAQGVALTAQRLRDALARHGVTPIPAVGEPFDPTVHEALLEVEAPEGAAPGTVVQEVLRGWRTAERALRAARVVVARERSEG